MSDEQEVIEIDLGKGKLCLIDAADFDLVMKYSWRFSYNTKYKDRGYVVATGTKPDGRKGTFTMHRLLMNPPKDKHVDHINGNTLDNRRSNLRLASRSQNMFNMRKLTPRSSQYKGVFWHKEANKWQAYIMIDGRSKSLGRFKDEAEAALAYDIAAVELRGEFACTNFPRTVLQRIMAFENGQEQGRLL